MGGVYTWCDNVRLLTRSEGEQDFRARGMYMRMYMHREGK